MACQRVRSGLQTTSKVGKELRDDGKVAVLLKVVRKSLPESKGPAGGGDVSCADQTSHRGIE